MNLFRKFYDVDAPVQEAGGEVSVAALMAKSGYNSENRPSETEVENKGNNEQAEQTEVETQAAPVSAETKVENAVQEAETPVETKVEPIVEIPKQVEAVQQPTWQEVLKQQQPDTVLKELGFDDNKVGLIQRLKTLDPKMIAFLDTWESNGDVVSYLREMTTDYKAMSSEEVMRNQLRDEYPTAGDKTIEILFKKKVIDAYSLDPEKYSESEVEEGRLLLDAEADRYRPVLEKRQQEKILPKAPEAKPIVPDTTEQDNLVKFENYKQEFKNEPYIKDVFTNNKLTIGEGEDKFNFPVNPQDVVDVLWDEQKWNSAVFDQVKDQNGNTILKPKHQNQALLGTVAKYGMEFINALAEHYKTIGSKKVIDPIDNAKPTGTELIQKSEVISTNPASAMAKGGRLVSN